MCFFSQPKTPTPSPAPIIKNAPVTPAPSPTPTKTAPEPSQVSPQEARRKQLGILRYGLASTIKTSPRGVSGSGADLYAPAAYGKTKLGQ